jgi:tight adherence protein C
MDSLLGAAHSELGHSQIAETLFIVLAGAAVFVLSLCLFAFAIAFGSPLRRRLGQLASPDADATSWTSQVAARMSQLGTRMLPRKKQERSRVARLLVHAGYRSPHALSLFYAAKASVCVVLPLAVMLASPLMPRVSSGQLVFYALVAAFLGSLVPSIWLDHSVQSRQVKLRVAFPDALDLLVVCVESGLGLAAALQRVADELAVGHPDLGTELNLVNAEMRAGVDRTQALKNLAERTGLEDIRGLVALMVQTMRFGTSIADALRVYSEEFRDKRMQAAEEQAAKIGTKMIFPLVSCLFPSFFLVAVGPAALRLVAVFGQLAH